MKHQRLLSFFFVFMFMLSSSLFAQRAYVDSVNIVVDINHEGDARIVERWTLDAITGLTEWYLVEQNLGAIEIRDFSVSEGNRRFVCEGEWDVDRSIDEKRFRCGWVTKSDGYELCWGLGSMDHHVFDVSYTMTNFVKAFDDANGFNHMFVARGISSSPQKVTVSIGLDSTELIKDNCRIWSFGHYGEIQLRDGRIEAVTTEPFSSDHSMIIMARFNSDLLSPTNVVGGSFDDFRNVALESSEYGQPDAFDEAFGYVERKGDLIERWFDDVFGKTFGFLLFGLFVLICIVVLMLIFVCTLVFGGPYILYAVCLMPLWTWIQRKRYFGKTIDWYRDIPLGGDITKACYVHESMTYSVKEHKERVTAAIILRLVYRKVLSLVQEMDSKGNTTQILQVNPWIDYEGNANENTLEKDLYEMIKAAAGPDGRLQKTELKQWGAMKMNQKQLYKWQQLMNAHRSYNMSDKTEIQHLFGLKRFLQEFTLVDERGMVEVELWKEYLVYATAFGIADQVRQDFRKVCPEYFEMTKDIIDPEQMQSATTPLDDFSWVLWHSIAHNQHAQNVASAQAHRAGSSWGGGGGSSFGGGGGFSGGGFGGGGR